MDEQKTQTSAQPESVPLLLIARELWRKLGLILMFAATAAACGYIAATLLYRPCLLYTSPSPRDPKTSRMPSSA